MVRRISIVAFTIIVLIICFVAYIFISTGFFRAVENTFDGEIIDRIDLSGAEDLAVSVIDSFAIISSMDRKGILPEGKRKDGLYYLDLKSQNFELTCLTDGLKMPFHPHGISMINRGKTYYIMAINHTVDGHSIEVFELNGQNLTHKKTLKDQLMRSPNDLVMLDENRFYFTNDHAFTGGVMRLIEDYAGLAMSDVVYFDGISYHKAAKGVAYPNGINIDRDRKLIFVASTRRFLVNVYIMHEDGSLDYVESIDCGTGVDNIELDAEGHLWIGTHPNLLRFAAYAKGKEETAPSEIIKITYQGTGDYTVETVYLEDGSTMSGSSVAAPFGDLILTGNVMDSAFLILKRIR